MNGSAIRSIIKVGGLTFSGLLTISLFVRLFGVGAYGLTMAVAALALFEIGAYGWANILVDAREGQRAIATTCLCITIALSLVSSIIEIVLATRLGAETLALLDLEFITLFAIGIALSTNIIGAIAYQFNSPDVARQSRELDRQARIKRAQESYRDRLTSLALTKSEEKIEGMAAEIANVVADGTAQQVVTQLLANSPRRELPPPTATVLPSSSRSYQFAMTPPPSPVTTPPFQPTPPMSPPPTPNSNLNTAEDGKDKIPLPDLDDDKG